MSDQLQLDIPEMPPPSLPKPKKRSAQKQLADLECRVLQLEVDVTQLRIGDIDHG